MKKRKRKFKGFFGKDSRGTKYSLSRSWFKKNKMKKSFKPFSF